MIARIYTLYWDNIDPALLDAQRRVCAHFGFAVEQHRINGLDHGEWIDWVMARMDDVDVFLFLDADCIPLSAERLVHGFTTASTGTLFGAEGAANHIDPARSYAGPGTSTSTASSGIRSDVRRRRPRLTTTSANCGPTSGARVGRPST